LLEANFAGSDTPVKSNGTQQGFQKGKRSTTGAPRCSMAGAAKHKEEHSRGSKMSTARAAKQKEKHSKGSKIQHSRGCEIC